MARIAKSGLEYFPFDVDFFSDIRIRKLIKRQGGKAVTVYALLLCIIYKNGYYMQWDEELPFICSESSGFEEAYISEVIKTCLSLGLFNKNLYDTEGILTSKGIQLRYCNIQRLNKRMSRIDKYCLLDEPQRTTSAKGKTKPDQDKKPMPEAPETAHETAAKATTTPEKASGQPGSNSEWLDEFFADNHSENLKLLCKNFGLGFGDIKRLRSLAKAVVTEWELSHTEHRDYSDWSRHLISAMRIKNRDTIPSKKSKNQSDDLSAPPDYTFNGGFGGADV